MSVGCSLSHHHGCQEPLGCRPHVMWTIDLDVLTQDASRTRQVLPSQYSRSWNSRGLTSVYRRWRAS